MEFTFNNIFSTTTSISPFFMNKEYYLNITVHYEYNIVFSYKCDFIVNFEEL